VAKIVDALSVSSRRAPQAVHRTGAAPAAVVGILLADVDKKLISRRPR
jgi:hypothetical protein